MHLYKSLEILLKENNKLLYTRYPIVARALGLARRASKGILHTKQAQKFWSVPVHVNLVQNRASYKTISFLSNLICFLWIYSTRLKILLNFYRLKILNNTWHERSFTFFNTM